MAIIIPDNIFVKKSLGRSTLRHKVKPPMKEINEEILYFLQKYQIDNNLKGIYNFSKSLVSVGYQLKNTDIDSYHKFQPIYRYRYFGPSLIDSHCIKLILLPNFPPEGVTPPTIYFHT